MNASSILAPGFSLYLSIGRWARPHFRSGYCSGGIVCGWLALCWTYYDLDSTLGSLVRNAVTVTLENRLCTVLDDPAVFRAWLASHPAEDAFEIPEGLHPLEHYLRENGISDAECQCECGSRECDGCERCDSNGGWQNIRWFGTAEEMSSWMFYDVLGRDVDLAQTWGEAVEAFDHALAVARWARSDDPNAPNPYEKVTA